MDKYTKGILTVIAVWIVALNIQILNGGGFISKAYAMNNVQKVVVCSEYGTRCANVSSFDGLSVKVSD